MNGQGNRRMNRARLACVVLATMSLVLVTSGPASAAAGPANMSENPVNTTPHVLDGEVVRFVQSGNTMYVGGTFTKVRNAGTTSTIARRNFFAFDVNTGRVLPLTLDASATVFGIVPSGQFLYLAGSFPSIRGEARKYLVKWDLVNNRFDPTFKPARIGGIVTDMELANGRLIVSGNFGKKIVALNPTTGADTGYINIPISGTLSDRAGPTKVYRFAVNAQRTRIVILGNFTSVGGAARRQTAMLLLGATSTTVGSWYDLTWNKTCALSIPHYTRDVDFSSDGASFVIVTGGGHNKRDVLCDTVVKYNTNDQPDAVPAWVNHSSQDTLLGVEVTGNSVYVGGHQKAMDVKVYQNGTLVHEEPTDGPNYSAPREGIAAIDYTTGWAQSWNPGRIRGVGARELYATPAGLWVGSDTERFGGEYHARIAMVPRI